MTVSTVQYVNGANGYQPDRQSPHERLRDANTSPDGKNWSFEAWEWAYRSLGDLGMFASMSYDFAPPLGRELNRAAAERDVSDPEAAAAIRKTIVQMEEPLAENGIAMTAVHAIQPFRSEADKQILIQAGIQDFVASAGRRPAAFWLPEGAVDTPTLKVLAANGVQAFICAPEQVNADRPRMIHLARGLGILALPFDSSISRNLAFDPGLRRNAEVFADWAIKPVAQSRRRSNDPTPIVTFVDLETGGVYDRGLTRSSPYEDGSDKFMGHLGKVVLTQHYDSSNPMEIISINRMIKDIAEGRLQAPDGAINENTAWSCSDGLVRWNGERNCGESGGAEWKRPFYLAHDRLNAAVTELVRAEMGLAGADNDEEFVQRMVATFNEAFANPGGHASSCELSLASAKVAALVSLASCGTFYSDPGTSGWQNIVFARTAIEHLHDAGLHRAARQIWDEYLYVLRQMPAHHLQADTSRGTPRTALHLLS